MDDEQVKEILADTINALLDDLEQDVIAEMPPSYEGGEYHEGQLDAFNWMIQRLKTYHKE